MNFKKLLLCVALVAGGSPVWAQTSAVAGNIDPDAERARLTRERAEIDARAKAEQTACYQRFAVEDCLQESRRKRRTAEDSIKRQEADLNDMERKRRAADTLERLDKAPPRAVDDPAAQERARQSQQGREQRAADHAASRAEAAAKAEDNRRALENKQRNHAEQQAKAARLQADAPTERARFERKQEQAARHRADVERKNAERTKPRSAPLPTPP